ncbi:MAG: hypothetical protein OEM82_04020 [Acidobacteriota bacterium]|nr:hypothetical protein [Acidobacteriota bacterium]MDH3530388.1 hypothetical protein [Acidobacteriota bacterium]
MKRRGLCILFILFAVATATAFGQTNGGAATSEPEIPADFESDGCTWFPDGNYRDCCVAHDEDYFKGGSCRQRRESDARLYRCVKSKKGWRNKILAPIMWVGVRVLGSPILPTRFRWGFGIKNKKKEKRKMQKFNLPTPTGTNELAPPDSEAPADDALINTAPGPEKHMPDIQSPNPAK